jgi:uncharacterized protein (UPF0305 family)
VAVSEEDRAKQQAADKAQAAKIAAERTQQYGKVTCHYRVYLRNTPLGTGALGMGKEGAAHRLFLLL